MDERQASNRTCIAVAALLCALLILVATTAGCSPAGSGGQGGSASASASGSASAAASNASSHPGGIASNPLSTPIEDKNASPDASSDAAALSSAASSAAGSGGKTGEGGANSSGSSSSSAAVPEQAPAKPRDIRSLPAGEVVTAQEIEAFSEDACFTVGEIDDAVFARMQGNSYGADCTVPREELRYIRVLHADAEGAIHVGELVMNVALAQEVCEIFRELYHAAYPIEKMHLVDDYGGDDNASMADNNTSSFNYRTVPGSSNLSKHAYGRAIDINPYYNPYVPNPSTIMPDGTWQYADRSWSWTYKIEEGDLCHRLFVEHGFTWGGYWGNPDYQHFAK